MTVWTAEIDGVERDIAGLEFTTGAQRNANPQRPTGAWGSGALRIHGYRTQTRKKLKIKVNGTDRVEAWIQNENYDQETGFSSYTLEGLLLPASRVPKMVTQGAANANANQAAVINKLRDAFGLSAIQSSLRSTPLSLYSFDGPAGGYASQFGLVSGGLPYATQLGLLGIKDPTLVPNTLNGTFGSRTHRVRDIISNFDSEHLRNVLSTQYPSVIDGMAAATVSPQAPSRSPQTLPNGAPVTGDDVLLMDRTTTGYPVTLTAPAAGGSNRIISGRFRIRPFSSVIVQRNNDLIGTIRYNSLDQTAAGVFDQYVTGSVQGNGSLSGTIGARFTVPFPNGRSNVHENRWYVPGVQSGATAVYYQVLAEYKLEVPDSAPVMVSNDTSITEWDPRPLTLPGWIQRTATASLQARIDALAGLRNLRTVDMYVDQRDTAKTNAVAAIEPGHYIALPDVGTIVFVMNVSWHLSSVSSGIKRLLCIDTGTDHTPTIPTDALTWRTDELTWRSDYLQWSRA